MAGEDFGICKERETRHRRRRSVRQERRERRLRSMERNLSSEKMRINAGAPDQHVNWAGVEINCGLGRSR